MPTERIASLKSGMTRLRRKGGARPDSLFDLVNGKLDSAGAPYAREGTRFAKQVSGLGEDQVQTFGLVTHRGQRVVFASRPATVGDDKYRVEVLRHPTGGAAEIKSIDFARPVLGYLYVTATFTDGVVEDYWLQNAPEWTPNTVVLVGEMMSPTSGANLTGYAYRAERSQPAAPKWRARVARSVGDVVEPTTYNGYQYRVQAVAGENPTSGDKEPAWVASEGALVYEDANAAETDDATTGDSDTTLPGSVDDRYNTKSSSSGDQ